MVKYFAWKCQLVASTFFVTHLNKLQETPIIKSEPRAVGIFLWLISSYSQCKLWVEMHIFIGIDFQISI